jgi:hypothetical protein
LGWAEGFLGKNEENQRDSKFQDTKKKWSAKKCGKNPFRREICFEKEGGVCVPKSQRMQNHPNWSSIWVWAVAHIFESWNIRPNHAEKLPCCSHMTAWVSFLCSHATNFLNNAMECLNHIYILHVCKEKYACLSK